MAYKIDVREIITAHINTLVNDNTGKPDFRDWVVFLIIPILLPIVLLACDVFIVKDFIDSIIGGLSIFIGLALNLLVLIYDILQKEGITEAKKSFAKDLIANISFSILLSLCTIISSLLTLIDCDDLIIFFCIHVPCYIKYMTNGVTYFLLIEMVLVIVLLVKNMYHEMISQVK